MDQTNTMNQYWKEYAGSDTTTDGGTGYIYRIWPNCDYSELHWYPSCYWPPENKTEKAFGLLKLFVEEKIIAEPETFKKFCELVEKIAKVI